MYWELLKLLLPSNALYVIHNKPHPQKNKKETYEAAISNLKR